jgi:hypothetical protein
MIKDEDDDTLYFCLFAALTIVIHFVALLVSLE